MMAVAATPVAAWWLIGDQSEHVRGPESLDYVMRAPDVPDRLVTAAGSLALVTAAVCVVVLRRGARHERLDSRWVGVVGLLMVAGFCVAAIGRTVTAGVVGANIGAGLAVLVVGPVVVGLIAIAVFVSIRTRRTRALAL